jgi:putative oxidoreductase
MNAPTAATEPTGLVGAYRSLWKEFERVPIALPVLVMRAGVALVFWRSGQSKLPLGNESTVGLFRDIYQVPLLPPELATYLATLVEISCPVLLLLGMLARPAAAVLLLQTIIIQLFVFPANYPDHLLWAGPLLYLLLRGPGKWSLDAAIRDRIGGGR